MVDLLAIAAEPNRRRILQLLAIRPMTVTEIAAEFPVTRSAVSQHLLLLTAAGFITAEKSGRQRIYRVRAEGLRNLRAEIDRFWTNELDRLVAEAHILRRNLMSYTKSTVLPVGPDEAFALLTEPERLRRWQTISAVVDLRAGGSFRWTVTPGHVASGTFREVEPGRRIVFGWGWDGDVDLPFDASTVTITVEPVENGSLITLSHDGLTEAQAERHAMGWDHYLARLERLAATGDAGADEWAQRPEQLSPVVAAEAVLAAIQPVLRNLTPADQPKPTPCEEFTCHQVADHLMDSLEQVAAMAGVTAANPVQGSLEHRVSTVASEAIDAWRKVDLDATLPLPGGAAMPASYLAGILPLELALHGWDLAQASGQTIHLSDELAGYLRGLAEIIVPGGRGDTFADAVVPARDASALDRLAAYAGRSPIAA